MSDHSKIDWCDATISPVGWGCYGPGGTAKHPRICSYCYAKRIADRGLSKCRDCNDFVPHWHPEALDLLAKWKKPRRVFVQGMGDLFGNWVHEKHLIEVLSVVDRYPQHTFLFLTKNPLRMAQFSLAAHNVWAGITVTNQADADERIPLLMSVSAAHRFVSVEPMLGAVDLASVQFDRYTRMNVLEGAGISERANGQTIPNSFCTPLDWVIIGTQTGRGAAPIDPQWVADLTAQCDAAMVPVFHKRSLLRYGFGRCDVPR